MMSDASQEQNSQSNSDQNQGARTRFPVVGLGASAGGLQALKRFFEGMPAESGMAFVVIMHLSPEHESHAAESLQNTTRMTVTQVTKAVKVEPNHVYLIPPTKHLAMEDGVIRLSAPKRPVGRRGAVDLFFRTLADAHQAYAICIVLSGTGADGSVGVKRVRAEGGVAIAQDPLDAEYDSMPRNAINTGMVDFVLPVIEMPEKLIELWQNMRRIQLPVEAEAPVMDESQAEENALCDVLANLRTSTGHDFTHYKRERILRRIGRRMRVNTITELPAYRDFLHATPTEPELLLKDLLIGVTNFFRDREAFDSFEREVVPLLFVGKRTGDVVRVWCAGCATGEEAYSVAMLLLEQAARMPHPPEIQVFATDIDENAIAAARTGSYPEAIEADVAPTRLRKFFTKEPGGYHVNKEVRGRILFAVHNLIKDPPLSKLDAVTCRNLLIYFNRDVQEQVFELLHFALLRGGFIFLGSSETTDGAPDSFAPVNKKHRLFRAQTLTRQARVVPAPPLEAPASRARGVATGGASPGDEMLERKRITFGELHQQLVEQYAPPSVIVNSDYEIVYLSENVGRFLNYGGGEPGFNLLKAVLPELRLELRAALYQAAQTVRSTEARRVKLERGGRKVYVNMIVCPTRGGAEGGASYALVLFEEVEEALGEEGKESPGGDGERDAVVRGLEEETQCLREQLQATVEQYETTVEELKSSNEEMQSINEELLLAGEELKTRKEELQSVVEELRTVNQELKSTVEEVSEANDDLKNLMASTEIATVFLDRSLHIKRYTPRALDLFNLIPSDAGRPLTHITHKLDYANLHRDAEEVLADLGKIEREVSGRDGRQYIARLLPYRTAQDRIDGVVLNFVDITERKRAEDKVRESEARQAYFLKLSDALRPLADPNKIKAAATRVLGEYLAADRGLYAEHVRKGDEDFWLIENVYHTPEYPFPNGLYPLKNFGRGACEALQGNTVIVNDVFNDAAVSLASKETFKAASIAAYVALPLLKAGKLVALLGLHQATPREWKPEECALLRETAERTWDAVTRARAEEELHESETRFRRVFSNNMVAMGVWTKSGGIRDANDALLNLIGYTHEELEAGKINWTELTPPEYGERDLQAVAEVEAHGYCAPYEKIYIHKDGHPIPIVIGGGHFDGRTGAGIFFAVDITERKRAEEALRENEERLGDALRAARMGSWRANLATGLGTRDANLNRILGHEAVETTQAIDDCFRLIHSDDKAAAVAAWQKAVDTQGIYETEFRLVREDGTIRWLHEQGRFVAGEAGKPDLLTGLTTDISERKEAEEQLRESEERFRALIDKGVDVITISDRAGNITYVSPSIEAMSGYTVEEFTKQHPFSTIHPEDLPRCEAALQRLVDRPGESIFLQHRYRHKSGEWRWLEGTFTSLFHDPAVGGLVANFRDVTGRKLAEERLNAIAERLQTIFEASRDGILVEEDECIVYVNQAYTRLFGYEAAEELIGKHVSSVIAPEDTERLLGFGKIRMRGELPSSAYEFKGKRKDGALIEVEASVSASAVAGRTYITTMIRDITERKRAEDALRQLNEQLERRVAERTAELVGINTSLQAEISERQRAEWERAQILRRLVMAQEDERRRIARDMHDQFGQQLTALLLKLGMLKEDCCGQEGLREQVESLESIASQLDRDVDFLVWELRPTVLDDLGLREALANFARNWSKHFGIPVEVHTSGMREGRLTSEIETMLYRIAQEALNNISKHARARSVNILLEQRAGFISLIVEDDGVGFVVEEVFGANDKGLGLVGMRERAALVGGMTEIESRPGEGTTVIVRIPAPPVPTRGEPHE